MSGELVELAEAIESLTLPTDADLLAALLPLTDRLDAKVAVLAGEVEAAGLHEFDGAASLTGWLRQVAGMTNAGALSLSKLARRIHRLPTAAAAWAAGRLSTGQVEVLVGNITDRTADRFAETEADIVPSLESLDLLGTIEVVQSWRARIEAELDEEEPAEPEQTYHLSTTLDGRRVVSGSFNVDDGAVIEAALRLATTDDGDDDQRTPAERRADAEVVIHQFFLDHQRSHRGGRRRPHVELVVRAGDDGAPEGRLLDGTLLPESSVRRFLCDCAGHRVLTDGASAILDYGRATRTVPVDLFNALTLRDKHCRASGCQAPPEWCDAHHVWAWEDGGPTSLDNLVLKCRRHHTLHHKRGWHDKLLPDGTYEVTDPRGRVRQTRPSGMLGF